MSSIALMLAGLAQAATPAAPSHANHAGHAQHAQHSQHAQSGRMSSASTTIGDLFANPAARAIVERRLPQLSAHPQFGLAQGMTLRAVQPHSAGMITDAILAQIDADLAALPSG